MLVKGSAVMAGRSGSSNAGRDTSRISSDGGSVAWAGWLSSTCVCRAPMKRRPLRKMVRISCRFRPLSPTAVRAALIRPVGVRFRHNSTAPDRSNQIILADDTVAVLY